jgi:acetyl-CoA acyltransferase
MRSAVIVGAVRTASGKRYGQLSGWHPTELAAECLTELIRQSDCDPALVEDVLMGCVTQVGAQSTNIARNAVLAAGWPDSVPGTTIDRQCGSSQQAIHFAAQGVLAGAYDVVVAAGVESMSNVPMFSNQTGELSDPYGDVLRDRYSDRESYDVTGLVPQGISAELVADAFDLTRESLDEFALRSQTLAAQARDEGRFASEIVPVESRVRDRTDPFTVKVGPSTQADEGIRTSSLEQLSKLRPAFRPGGKVTAGNSSQISDGAAALLIMAEERASALGLQPLARFVSGAVAGSDPVTMLTSPIPATRSLLAKTGLNIADIDLFEVNEAFAPVVLAWAKELGVELDRINVNGGAIALGHPLGASGARLMTTLVHEMRRRRARYGLQTMCEGGGMANATLVERLN